MKTLEDTLNKRMEENRLIETIKKDLGNYITKYKTILLDGGNISASLKDEFKPGFGIYLRNYNDLFRYQIIIPDFEKLSPYGIYNAVFMDSNSNICSIPVINHEDKELLRIFRPLIDFTSKELGYDPNFGELFLKGFEYAGLNFNISREIGIRLFSHLRSQIPNPVENFCIPKDEVDLMLDLKNNLREYILINKEESIVISYKEVPNSLKDEFKPGYSIFTNDPEYYGLYSNWLTEEQNIAQSRGPKCEIGELFFMDSNSNICRMPIKKAFFEDDLFAKTRYSLEKIHATNTEGITDPRIKSQLEELGFNFYPVHYELKRRFFSHIREYESNSGKRKEIEINEKAKQFIF
ncbi:MAG: hypothetical protein ACOYT4_04045 [Nanoarchaeota archaeon]